MTQTRKRTEAPAAGTVESDLEAETLRQKLQRLFRTGPVGLRGRMDVGWEYDNRLQNTTRPGGGLSHSSPYVAPAVLLSYDHDAGPFDIAARYSVGYRWYLDGNFAGTQGDTTNSTQTASVGIGATGLRSELKSLTTASYGSGFDIESGSQRDRFTLAEALDGSYQLAEFTSLGARLAADISDYGASTGSNVSGLGRFEGTMFANYIWTGKTRFRFDLGAGRETQSSGGSAAAQRTYFQTTAGVHYEPGVKLAFDMAIGVGTRQDPTQSEENGGVRFIYSLHGSYAVTEKTAIEASVGLNGFDSVPNGSLLVRWQPRINTGFQLSAYQSSGFSNFQAGQNRTVRGVLGSVQERVFGRVALRLSAGYENQAFEGSAGSTGSDAGAYSFVDFGATWQIREWLVWQAAYRASTGRHQEGGESRMNINFGLTF